MRAPLLWAAPAFSAALSIATVNIPHFANPEISYTVDGIGLKGVCSQQLTFDLPASEYSADDFNRYDEVILTVSGVSLPKFYLSSKTPNGSAIKVTCYDRTIFSDIATGITEDDMTDGSMSTDALITRLENELGCSIAVGDIIPAIPKVSKDKIIGKKIREIISGLAEAACGYFAIVSDVLTFIPFLYEGVLHSSVEALRYSNIVYGLSKPVTGITLTDGSRVFSSGTALDPAANLDINTVYASSELMGMLVSAYEGKTYRAWGCSHVLINDYPPPGGVFSFGETELTANYLRLKITRFGLYASCGCNSVPADGFSSRTVRELNERVKIGEVNGSTKITRDGIKLVYINENARSSGGSEAEEYGFTVDKGGIAQFAGAMMDKVMPDKIERISGTSRKVYYSDKAFLLSWELDENGNTCNFTMSEVV